MPSDAPKFGYETKGGKWDAMSDLYSSVETLKGYLQEMKAQITLFHKNNPRLVVKIGDKPFELFFSELIDNVSNKLNAAEIELYEKEAMMLLKEYAMAEDDQLTESALNLKKRLHDIASWSLRQDGPNPVQKEINFWRDIVDGNEAIDEDFVNGMLDSIEKVLRESLYKDGKGEIQSILNNVKSYLTGRISQMLEERRADAWRAEDMVDDKKTFVDSCEESILLGRCDAALESISHEK